MANHPPAHSAGQPQAQQERQLQSLESRLEDLEEDLGSLLTGSSLRPEAPSRATRLSRGLILGGVLLIFVAIVLAIV